MRTFLLMSLILVFLFDSDLYPQHRQIKSDIDLLASQIESKIIQWRRDFHQHPELSGQEFETARKVAGHLNRLGLDVQTGIAETGVIGILHGSKPEPVIALRAEMDALPITEKTGLPFASQVKAMKNGEETGVMHACGHDAHTAILMGVAEILTQMKAEIPGTVKFIFQPAEEAAGGADEMVAAGVLENPKVAAILALHISSQIKAGEIHYLPGGMMASSDYFEITVTGKQTHGAMPWQGVDPIVVASQIVLGLQSVVSRQLDLTANPAVITIGKITGGVKANIIPEKVEMSGTIRALDEIMRREIQQKIRQVATQIAESAGAAAEVNIRNGTPVLYNNPQLTARLLPTLASVVGPEKVVLTHPSTVSEDFAFFVEKVPGFYFLIGGMPADVAPDNSPPHHSPYFRIEESGMMTGVRAFCYLVVDYLQGEDDILK